MKTFYICALIIVFFTSCSSYNKIITIDDRFKEETSIRLIQELEAYSDEKHSGFFDSPDYHVTLKTIYVKPAFQQGQVTAELSIITNIRPEELDSLIFIEADGEKYRLHSSFYVSRQFVTHTSSTETSTSVEKEKDTEDENKSKETVTTSTNTSTSGQTSQIMKRTFDISPDKWKSLSNLSEVMIRFYIEKEGVNAHFSFLETTRFTEFFNEVLKFGDSLNQSSSMNLFNTHQNNP